MHAVYAKVTIARVATVKVSPMVMHVSTHLAYVMDVTTDIIYGVTVRATT